MKYRLFGRDGVTDKEFGKLKDYVDPSCQQQPGPDGVEDQKQYVVKRRADYDYQLSIKKAREAVKKRQLERMGTRITMDDKSKVDGSQANTAKKKK